MNVTKSTVLQTSPFIRGFLAGIIFGAIILAFIAWSFQQFERRKNYDNYTWIVVAAQDIAPGTVLTLDMLKKEIIPDNQRFISQTISPYDGHFLIGARTLFALKTGEALFWNGLSVGLTHNQCQQACQWVAESGNQKVVCAFDARRGATNCAWTGHENNLIPSELLK